MQGMIEGKWLNRIGGDLAWKPASLGNNLLAQGPGIAGTLARLEDAAFFGDGRRPYRQYGPNGTAGGVGVRPDKQHVSAAVAQSFKRRRH